MWDDYVDAGRPPGSPYEEALARHYLPHATRLGEAYASRVGPTVNRDDIVQNGYLGLIEAIRKFDPEKASFRTFATRMIEWKIAEGLRGGDWLPRPRRAAMKAVQQAVADLQHGGVFNPSDEQVAHLAGVSLEAVRIASEDFVSSKVHSINDLTGADDTHGDEPANRLADRAEDSVDNLGLRHAEHDPLFEAIRELPDRQKQIVALYYYGLHDLSEIGQVFEISQSRVSQILKGVILRLKTSIGSPDAA